MECIEYIFLKGPKTLIVDAGVKRQNTVRVARSLKRVAAKTVTADGQIRPTKQIVQKNQIMCSDSVVWVDLCARMTLTPLPLRCDIKFYFSLPFLSGNSKIFN